MYYTAHRTTVLELLSAYREALNNLRMHTEEMRDENVRLTSEIDVLQQRVQTMKEIEEALGNLADQQGSDLNRLMDLIKENRKITDQQREYLKSKAVEDAIALVLEVDRDGSFNLNAMEIDQLILGLRLIDMIQLDEEAFRERVQQRNGDMRYVLRLIRNMLLAEELGSSAANAAGNNTNTTSNRSHPSSRRGGNTSRSNRGGVNRINEQDQAQEDAQVMRVRSKREMMDGSMVSLRDSKFFNSTRNAALQNIFSDIE
jgi:hypothetical protein